MAAKKTKPPNTPNAIMPPEKIYRIKMRLVLFYTPVRIILNTNNNNNNDIII